MRVLARLVFVSMLAVMSASSSSAAGSVSADTVVLLHGLGRGTWSMKRLEWALRADGYRVVNIPYPSRHATVEILAEQHLAPRLRALPVAPGKSVHFVTHSMGGIVLRCYLRAHPAPAPGRIVMLAPPNRGSEVADQLSSWWLYRMVNGPAGAQLTTHGLPGQLGPAPRGTGIIAGDFSFNPLFSSWMNGPGDGKVSVASARLDGASDFLVLPYSHTWLMWRQPVIDQVRAYLRDGKFAQVMPPAAD